MGFKPEFFELLIEKSKYEYDSGNYAESLKILS